MDAVHVEHVSKTFRSAFSRRPVTALRDVSLAVAPAEVFGLLGPNGAGKTTLVKILLGIVRPSEGAATLFGRPAADPRARAAIGYLPESHRFAEFLTAAQMLDLYGRLGGVSEADRRRRIPELLARVRLEAWADTKIRKFSKGMMQRLGLAQALLNEPALVFLDEPTDGVDPVGRREIRDLLVWLRERGTTVFLNSHLLSEVEQVCTRVAILHEGRLVRQGTVAELTAAERVYALQATPVPAALLAELPLAEAPGAPPGADAALRHYHVQASDRAGFNHVLDRLRTAGVEVEALHPLRRSLEESFIQTVSPSEPAPTGISKHEILNPEREDGDG